MLSINTNISSLIAQQSMTSATNKLNQAIERMTTGYKINGAKDNAANYSISQNMQTQLGSYDVAADNVAMGMDLVTTASDIISNMQDKASRLQALCTQARNGTYGQQSLAAINTEAGAIMSEIMRLYSTAEYNQVSLFKREAYTIAEHLPKAGKSGFIDESVDITMPESKAEYNGFIEDPKTYTDEEVAAMTKVADVSTFTSGQKYSISSVEELEKFANYVNAGNDTTGVEFVLGADIDLKAWSEAHVADGGWSPITDFSGTFNGNGHVISNLIINRASEDFQGLFCTLSAEVKNLAIKDAVITGKDNVGIIAGTILTSIDNCYVTGEINAHNQVGGLAGAKDESDTTNCYSQVIINATGDSIGGLIGVYTGISTISNCFSAGTVNSAGSYVGGLVGESTLDLIENCYTTATVSGVDVVGGLVGMSNGKISDSYATGTVVGANQVGGLCGMSNYTSLTNCYATGNVTGKNRVGGLSGDNPSLTTNCYATGNVTGERLVGGLFGWSYDGSLTENCYATGNVTGVEEVGGLAGCADWDSDVSNSYATGDVAGTTKVGGLIGSTDNNITNSYSTGTVTGENYVGGLVGEANCASYGTLVFENSCAYSIVKSADPETTGSFVGSLIVSDSTNTIDATSCISLLQNANAIGACYQRSYVSGVGYEYTLLADYDNSTILDAITGVVSQQTETTLQVGIKSDSSCQITFDTNFKFDLSAIEGNIASDEALAAINDFTNLLSEKSTQLGAVQNRLDSAIESITVNMENLTSSLSTIRDADIAEVSSEYIRQQILQQASATLLATANQSPSIALQLI